jgi:hypothetical protein
MTHHGPGAGCQICAESRGDAGGRPPFYLDGIVQWRSFPKMAKAHSERCRDCKTSVQNLLAARFGTVEANWDLNLPCRLEDYRNNTLYDALGQIYSALQRYRQFEQFVRVSKLSRVDFFISQRSLIVEFDESQHFTKPRDISLSLYPPIITLSVKKWRELCRKLDKRDNDPPFRDEQRAWYDTLRDFAPMLLGSGQTIRLYSRDTAWCSLNPSRECDMLTFEQILKTNTRS